MLFLHWVGIMFLKMKRLYIQLFSAVFFNLPFLALYLKYVPAPILNCYACPLAATACPIGTIQLFVYAGQIPYYTLALLGIYGLSLGRTFCGYLCPFGFFQDLLFKISKKEFSLPIWTGYLKYAVLLVFVIILPLFYLSPVFCKWCPAGSLEASLPVIGTEYVQKITGSLTFGFSSLISMVGFIFYFKVLLLVLMMTLFVFYKRPFCRICPLGAIFSFFSRIGLWNNQSRDASVCGSCSLCRKKCPAGINPEKDYLSHNCLQCNECKKNICP